MKTFLSLALGFLVSYSVVGQTASLEALRKENLKLKAANNKLSQDTAFLNKKVAMCDFFNKPKEFSVKSFNKNFDIEILSCRGNRDEQTVKVEFLISHSLPHQEICMKLEESETRAFDELGNMFQAKQALIGNQSEVFPFGPCTKVQTDVPIRGNIVFRNILPSSDILKYFTVALTSSNYDGRDQYLKGNLEVRNLKIEW